MAALPAPRTVDLLKPGAGRPIRSHGPCRHEQLTAQPQAFSGEPGARHRGRVGRHLRRHRRQPADHPYRRHPVRPDHGGGRHDRPGLRGQPAVDDDEDSLVLTAEQRRGLRRAGIAALVYILAPAAAVAPYGSPFRGENGSLLDSPLLSGIAIELSVLFLLAGTAYGSAVGTVRRARDVPDLITQGLRDIAPILVLFFTVSQFLAYFKWSKIGEVTAIHGAALLRSLGAHSLLIFVGKALSQTGGHGDKRPADVRVYGDHPFCGGSSRVADGEDGVRLAARDELRRGAHHIKVMASGGVASPTDHIDATQYSMNERRARRPDRRGRRSAGERVRARRPAPAGRPGRRGCQRALNRLQLLSAVACPVDALVHSYRTVDEFAQRALVDVVEPFQIEASPSGLVRTEPGEH